MSSVTHSSLIDEVILGNTVLIITKFPFETSELITHKLGISIGMFVLLMGFIFMFIGEGIWLDLIPTQRVRHMKKWQI